MISVVVPVYNGEKTIAKTVDSILNNTFQNFELILVDDGSTDETPAICESFAKKDKRVSVVHQKNRGLSGARNTGIDVAKGEYICFIDADDSIEESYFSFLNDYIERNQLDWVEAAYYVESSLGKATQSFFNEDKIYRGEEIRRYVQNHVFYTEFENLWLHSTSACGSIYRKDAIGELRFKEDVTYGEDIVFNYEFTHHIHSYGYLNQPLYHYLTYNSVMSSQYRKNFIKEIEHLLVTISDIRKKYKDQLGKEELIHAMKSFIGIFFMHIFPNSTHKTRKEKYTQLDEMLDSPKISEIYTHIQPNITDNLVLKIVIWLFKQRNYETLYLVWILRNIRNKSIGDRKYQRHSL